MVRRSTNLYRYTHTCKARSNACNRLYARTRPRTRVHIGGDHAHLQDSALKAGVEEDRAVVQLCEKYILDAQHRQVPPCRLGSLRLSQESSARTSGGRSSGCTLAAQLLLYASLDDRPLGYRDGAYLESTQVLKQALLFCNLHDLSLLLSMI